jgi:hypothetical protein
LRPFQKSSATVATVGDGHFDIFSGQRRGFGRIVYDSFSRPVFLNPMNRGKVRVSEGDAFSWNGQAKERLNILDRPLTRHTPTGSIHSWPGKCRISLATRRDKLRPVPLSFGRGLFLQSLALCILQYMRFIPYYKTKKARQSIGRANLNF